MAALHQEQRRRKTRYHGFLLVLLAALLWCTGALAAPARSDSPTVDQLSALKQIHTAFGAAYDSGERFVVGDKNSVELCNFAEKARSEGWNYVYGAKGQRMTAGLITSIISSNMGDNRTPYRSLSYIASTMRQSGSRATDCSGLVMDYMWWAGDASDPVRALCPSIGAYNANAMLDAASERGTMDTMPEMPGLLVHRNGHVGVYIGNGEVIEARGVKYGVTKTLLSERSWSFWSKSPWIDYELTGIYDIAGRTVFLDNGEDIGEQRWVAKFVYGEESAGGTYVPWFDPNATFVNAIQAVPDVEPGAGEAFAPDGSIVPIEQLPLVYQIMAQMNTLPYDARYGYLYQSHWYLLQRDANGNWQAVLNDPPAADHNTVSQDPVQGAAQQMPAQQPQEQMPSYAEVPPPVPYPADEPADTAPAVPDPVGASEPAVAQGPITSDASEDPPESEAA